MNSRKHRYILTGTPGSGKTTLIQTLAKVGHHVIHEAATEVIAIERNIGNKEPWKFESFIEKIVLLQKKRQIESNDIRHNCEFYDRSPICTYALALYLGFDVNAIAYLNEEIERIQKEDIYDKRVFFVENLGFIENTNARQITFDEALKFEEIHISTYKKFGYECIFIPPEKVQDRFDFIQRYL